MLPFHLAALFGLAAAVADTSRAQDFSVLRINEVLTDNETQDPPDSSGLRHDMVEIYNSGDVELPLGGSIFSERLALSDTEAQPLLGLWTFPAGTSIPAKGFLTVFLESDPEICDLHASFGLAREGSEPITLWGKIGTDGRTRPIIDQVWLPPLDPDVSFGRYPDGAGPAPVPVGETFDHFRFNPPGMTTFGSCEGACATFTRICRGAANGPGGNIKPRIVREAATSNNPAAEEPVTFIARVEDDKLPTAGNFARVLIRFSVNGAPDEEVPMTFDEASGILYGTAEGKPLKRWSLWTGTIPGQPAGAQVEFAFHVEDLEVLAGGDPDIEDLCPPGVGPCNEIGLPGPGCEKEPSPGLRFKPCNVRFRYVSGYIPPEPLLSLVVNEVVANQTDVLRDNTDAQFDDYVELFNASAEEVPLAGLWMSDKPFHPEGWQFPAGSVIGPREHLIVFTDADGGRCPRQKVPGDGQDCPDPTNPPSSYHTDFALERDGDQVYIFDTEATGFGVIHGTSFGPQAVNTSWSLIPDGSRSGDFYAVPPTPGAVNQGSDPLFLRGEVNGDCLVNLTDAVFSLEYQFRGGAAPACLDAADSDDNGAVEISDPVYLLNHLFQGGPDLPAPGIFERGPDPTPDELEACQESSCS